MNSKNILMVLYIALILVTACAVTALILMRRLEKKQGVQVRQKPKGDFFYAAYGFCKKFSLMRKYMEKIRRQIELLDLSDEWTICRKTMRFTFLSLGITISVFLFLVHFSNSLYFMVISAFTVYMLHGQLLRMFVEKTENKILRQFEVFIGNVRHHFHEHGMIDESIYDSIEECGYEVSLHANRIYEVLTASNIDERMEQYNETAPNKFMKTFTTVCYLVQRFGDKAVDGKSIFLNNLNYLKQEMNMELLRREKLGHLFKSLSVIAVFPIFTIKPLEHWAVSNIPELTEYYEGAYGFLVMILLFILILGTYQLISRLQSSAQYTPVENALYVSFLKIPMLRDFIEGMVEKHHHQAIQCDKLLKKTGSRMSVNQFYMKQILFAASTLVLSIGMFVNVHALIRNNLLYSSESLRAAKFDEQINLHEEIRLIESDREYILKFRGMEVSFRQIEQALLRDKVYTGQGKAGIAAKRIMEKLSQYNRHDFKWWELLLCFVFAGVAYGIPFWMLLFRERILRMNREDEVMQFHTIILMLMHIERIHVEDILFWMEQFSDMFKASITKCINNYEYGDKQALEQLVVDEPYTPFVRIVENLQSAADKITIEHAFDELRSEREYYQEKRKQDNEILINKKGMWGKFFAFIPFGATVIFYLIVPFVLVSISQLTGFSEEIHSVL